MELFIVTTDSNNNASGNIRYTFYTKSLQSSWPTNRDDQRIPKNLPRYSFKYVYICACTYVLKSWQWPTQIGRCKRIFSEQKQRKSKTQSSDEGNKKRNSIGYQRVLGPLNVSNASGMGKISRLRWRACRGRDTMTVLRFVCSPPCTVEVDENGHGIRDTVCCRRTRVQVETKRFRNGTTPSVAFASLPVCLWRTNADFEERHELIAPVRLQRTLVRWSVPYCNNTINGYFEGWVGEGRAHKCSSELRREPSFSFRYVFFAGWANVNRDVYG